MDKERQLGRGCGRGCQEIRAIEGRSSSLRPTCFCISPESRNADPSWQGVLRSCEVERDDVLWEGATSLTEAHLSIQDHVHGCDHRLLEGLMESANGTRHTRSCRVSRRLYFRAFWFHRARLRFSARLIGST
jgi:hypothetical protein